MLSEPGYVDVVRQARGRRSRSLHGVAPAGRAALAARVDALKAIITAVEPGDRRVFTSAP